MTAVMGIKKATKTWKHIFLIWTVLLLFVVAGTSCQNHDTRNKIKEQEPLKTIEYSNLTDQETRSMLAERLHKAGLSEENLARFFCHVDLFNQSVDSSSLTTGFERADVLSVKYDPYEMQDEWMAAHPDFEGYNCRITAFELFQDFLEIANGMATEDSVLFLDKVSLETDPSALSSAEDLGRFYALFSSMETEASPDIAIHAEQVRQVWQERGIHFKESTEIRLISVFFHDQPSPNESTLFIGHTGILLMDTDLGQDLYFLEKVAFQEPYRLLKFHNRTELSDYLMEKYDISWGQETAKPFIFENDQLMDGYRPNPVNPDPSTLRNS